MRFEDTDALMVIIWILIFLDTVFTYIGLSLGFKEINPVMNFLILNLGIFFSCMFLCVSSIMGLLFFKTVFVNNFNYRKFYIMNYILCVIIGWKLCVIFTWFGVLI